MNYRKYMTTEEVSRLRTHAEGESLIDLEHGRRRGPLAWLLVDFALSTGLRVSEIAQITLVDVDTKRKILTVHRAKKREIIPGKFKPGKDGKQIPCYKPRPVVESLAISPELSDHLRQYIDNQRPASESDRLWVGKRGPMTKVGLQLLWQGALRRAGLTNGGGKALYSIHGARHTLAVCLLRKTGNLRQVQAQLGHSSPVTTANLYAQVTEDDMRAGVTDLYKP